MNSNPFVLCINIIWEEQRRISLCVAQTYLLSILMEMCHYLTTPWPSWIHTIHLISCGTGYASWTEVFLFCFRPCWVLVPACRIFSLCCGMWNLSLQHAASSSLEN